MSKSQGWGTLIFSCIRRLGSFFWVQICEFQYFWGVLRKMNVFWGMKILWIFLWGQPKIGLVLEVISMYFRVFSKGKYTESVYFGGLQKFQIFLVCLKFLIFLGGEW